MSHTSKTPQFARLDCETRAQLSRFLRPLLDAATDWAGLAAALAARGYGVAFQAGRLVVIDTMSGRAICTGSDIDCPLASLANRLGRPRLKLAADGRSAALA